MQTFLFTLILLTSASNTVFGAQPAVNPACKLKSVFYQIENPSPPDLTITCSTEIQISFTEKGFRKVAKISFDRLKKNSNLTVNCGSFKVLLNSGTPEFKPFAFQVALGTTYSQYSEGSTGAQTTLVSPTPKLSFSYSFRNSWRTGASLFFNALPFAVSESPAGIGAIRFYGINGRVGYEFKGTFLGFNVTPYLGLYYWGMLTEKSNIGISFLTGPQFFLSLSKVLSPVSWKKLGLYFKYAPVADGLQSFKIGNQEIAIGTSYSWAPSKTRWILAADLSSMGAAFEASAFSFSLNTYSLSFGLEI